MKQSFLILSVVMILAVSCNHAGTEYSTPPAKVGMGEPDVAYEAAAVETDEEITVTDRKIIKAGNINFRTSDIESTRTGIIAATEKQGGYISKNEITDHGYRIQCNLEIRVPFAKFDTLLKNIESNAEDIESQQMHATDVTEEFIDIEARLQTKKTLESRYRELLSRAISVEDILKIEEEIGKLREEIESVEGRLRYLNDRVSLSTLNVSFYVKKIGESGNSSRFGESLSDGWSGLLSFVFGLVSIWPFILVMVAVFVCFRWYMRKRKVQRQGQNR